MREKFAGGIVVHVLLLVVILSLAGWYFITQLAFWSPDVGVRYIQAKQLIAQEWQTFAIPYWAQAFDPTWQHAPHYLFAAVGNELYLAISPFFPLLSSGLMAGLGRAGLVVLPVLGGTMTAAGAYKLARACGLRRARTLLWATVFATPVLFYSLQFWDHTVGVALATWATYWTARGIAERRSRYLLLGGIAAAAAMEQRPELYLFVLALGLGTLLAAREADWRRRLSMAGVLAGGGLAGALPLWYLQYRWLGHPLGFPVANNIFGYGHVASLMHPHFFRPWAASKGYMLFYVRGSDFVTFAALLLAAGGLAALVFALRQSWPHRRRLFAMGLALSLLGFGLWLWTARQIALLGLFTTFPLLAFSVGVVALEEDPHGGAERAAYRLSLLVALLFVALMLIVWPGYGGFEWGARYLLPAYPLLLVAAFYNYEARRRRWRGDLLQMLQFSFVALLLMAVALQLTGVRGMHLRQAQAGAAREAVASIPAEVILTSNRHLPNVVAALEEKRFLYVANEEELAPVIEWLQQQGVTRFALVPEGGVPVPRAVNGLTVEQVSPAVFSIGR